MITLLKSMETKSFQTAKFTSFQIFNRSTYKSNIQGLSFLEQNKSKEKIDTFDMKHRLKKKQKRKFLEH